MYISSILCLHDFRDTGEINPNARRIQMYLSYRDIHT